MNSQNRIVIRKHNNVVALDRMQKRTLVLAYITGAMTLILAILSVVTHLTPIFALVSLVTAAFLVAHALFLNELLKQAIAQAKTAAS